MNQVQKSSKNKWKTHHERNQNCSYNCSNIQPKESEHEPIHPYLGKLHDEVNLRARQEGSGSPVRRGKAKFGLHSVGSTGEVHEGVVFLDGDRVNVPERLKHLQKSIAAHLWTQGFFTAARWPSAYM
jgi:hypothetical protein